MFCASPETMLRAQSGQWWTSTGTGGGSGVQEGSSCPGCGAPPPKPTPQSSLTIGDQTPREAFAGPSSTSLEGLTRPVGPATCSPRSLSRLSMPLQKGPLFHQQPGPAASSIRAGPRPSHWEAHPLMARLRPAACSCRPVCSTTSDLPLNVPSPAAPLK